MAAMFRRSDRMSFGSTAETYRMNFSLLFDDPAVYSERPAAYARRFETFEALAVGRRLDPEELPLDTAEVLWEQAGALVEP
jgi:hypothetical protein